MLWRMHKSTGVASDSQLIPVEQLEEHVADLPEDEHKKLEVDVNTFLEYWSSGRKKHSADFVSHIFGIVSRNSYCYSQRLHELNQQIAKLTCNYTVLLSRRSSVMDSP